MHRRYVLTIHDESFDPHSIADFIRYGIFGRETCPTTKRKHWQGFICLSKPQRISYLKKHIHPTAHYEPSYGTLKQNKDYCSKEDPNPIIIGTEPTQGSRTDIYEFRDAILSKASDSDLVSDYPHQVALYPKFIQTVRSSVYSHRSPDNPPDVRWYYGPSGSGKTSAVYNKFPAADIYNGFARYPFFNGYTQQPVCLLDDFRKGDIPFNFLLRLLDRYPFTVETKGSSVPFNSPVIIITSPYHFDGLYFDEDNDQISRRIKNKLYFSLDSS